MATGPGNGVNTLHIDVMPKWQRARRMAALTGGKFKRETAPQPEVATFTSRKTALPQSCF